jgi:hypothetical protein
MNMMTFEIESGVPIPAVRLKRKRSKYPFATLKVGESFLVPATGADKDVIKNRLSALISGEWHRETSRRFTLRRMRGGIRVWRTS